MSAIDDITPEEWNRLGKSWLLQVKSGYEPGERLNPYSSVFGKNKDLETISNPFCDTEEKSSWSECAWKPKGVK